MIGYKSVKLGRPVGIWADQRRLDFDISTFRGTPDRRRRFDVITDFKFRATGARITRFREHKRRQKGAGSP